MSPTEERDWLVVGQVVKPHGVHGDLVVDVITDFPERLADGVRFGVGDGAEPLEGLSVVRCEGLVREVPAGQHDRRELPVVEQQPVEGRIRQHDAEAGAVGRHRRRNRVAWELR